MGRLKKILYIQFFLHKKIYRAGRLTKLDVQIFLESAYLLLKLKELFRCQTIGGHRTRLRNKLD